MNGLIDGLRTLRGRYGFELEWRISRLAEGAAATDADAEPAAGKGGDCVSKGSLTYVEVSSTAIGESVAVGDIKWKATREPPAAEQPGATAALEALKAQVQATLDAFDRDFRATRKI